MLHRCSGSPACCRAGSSAPPPFIWVAGQLGHNVQAFWTWKYSNFLNICCCPGVPRNWGRQPSAQASWVLSVHLVPVAGCNQGPDHAVLQGSSGVCPGYGNLRVRTRGQCRARGGRAKLACLLGCRSAKIATRKGKADAQRAKLYGKLGEAVALGLHSGAACRRSLAANDFFRCSHSLGVPCPAQAS